MADTFQFDLVSPERRLASLDAKAVRIPGAEGDMTAMPDHSPVITTLRPGVLTVETAGGEEAYIVTGGFAEITAESTTVLAESAMPKAEVTRAYLDDLVAKARDAQGDEISDTGAKLIADLSALGDQIGV
ncbi:MAG: F0F1 ATP synthase subunit epsilon [Pseudomonadota bacterium]